MRGGDKTKVHRQDGCGHGREREREGDEMGAAERREERGGGPGRERVLLAIRALFAVNTPKRAYLSS